VSQQVLREKHHLASVGDNLIIDRGGKSRGIFKGCQKKRLTEKKEAVNRKTEKVYIKLPR
jgi:hypothetical protein